MVSDEQLLAGLRKCKELGAVAMVHAENGDAVAEGQRFVMEELGMSGPSGHALSRPAALEAEATGRAIKLARFVDTPLYVVHVMSEGAMNEVCLLYDVLLILVPVCKSPSVCIRRMQRVPPPLRISFVEVAQLHVCSALQPSPASSACCGQCSLETTSNPAILKLKKGSCTCRSLLPGGKASASLARPLQLA